ncbi:hypothetical protein EJ08DRAFT_729712 [Tothia fuscella]|uniref:Uncharacterized protein n=1 Tax=Tothia fuscella TaxID=1048955 RepID=A0A9P4U3Q2_9PEZI|nr:hypothetical protein EJ08DRAFT_729712 [Tothia fuscella]
MLRRTAFRPFSALPFNNIGRQQSRQIHFPWNGVRNLPSGQPVIIQRVRFRKPPVLSRSRIRNFILWALPVYIGIRAIDRILDIDIEIEDAEKVVGKKGTTDVAGVGGEEDEEGDVDSIFIPFGWPKPQPKTFYKGTDPEWQEFIKFSKDRDKQKDVQLRLVNRTRSEVSQRLSNKSVIGTIDTTKGRFWLETSFPPGPPQDYEVNGVEIADEFVAWSTKTVSQKEYYQLRTVLFPTAAMYASWSALRYQFDVQFNKIRSALGWKEQYETEARLLRYRATKEKVLGQVQALKQETEKKTQAAKDSTDAPSREAMDKSPESKSTDKRDGSDNTSKSGRKVDAATATSMEKANMSISIPDVDTTSVEGSPITMLLFWLKMSKNRQPMNIDPPRGTIVVSGLIEVVGSKGKSTFDVAAAWDPKANDFVASGWKHRKYTPKMQSPRGGK